MGVPGTAPLTSNLHALYAIILKFLNTLHNIMHVYLSELSKELKIGIEILVGQAVFEFKIIF